MIVALISILTVCGGLGFFLLGMKHLSEGLQAVGRNDLQMFMVNIAEILVGGKEPRRG